MRTMGKRTWGSLLGTSIYLQCCWSPVPKFFFIFVQDWVLCSFSCSTVFCYFLSWFDIAKYTYSIDSTMLCVCFYVILLFLWKFFNLQACKMPFIIWYIKEDHLHFVLSNIKKCDSALSQSLLQTFWLLHLLSYQWLESSIMS